MLYLCILTISSCHITQYKLNYDIYITKQYVIEFSKNSGLDIRSLDIDR